MFLIAKQSVRTQLQLHHRNNENGDRVLAQELEDSGEFEPGNGPGSLRPKGECEVPASSAGIRLSIHLLRLPCFVSPFNFISANVHKGSAVPYFVKMAKIHVTCEEIGEETSRWLA